jgi:mannan endo-1,4-beta-mannosidase
MRRAQLALSRFLPLIDWGRFARCNLNEEAGIGQGFRVFACGDADQALAWVLRTDSIGPEGTLRDDVPPRQAVLVLPGLAAGRYRVAQFDTQRGQTIDTLYLSHGGGDMRLACGGVVRDLAVAVVAVGGSPASAGVHCLASRPPSRACAAIS